MQKEPLKDRDLMVLALFGEYYLSRGVFPLYEEVMQGTNMSHNQLELVMNKLQLPQQGYLNFDAGRRQLTQKGLDILGIDKAPFLARWQELREEFEKKEGLFEGISHLTLQERQAILELLDSTLQHRPALRMKEFSSEVHWNHLDSLVNKGYMKRIYIEPTNVLYLFTDKGLAAGMFLEGKEYLFTQAKELSAQGKTDEARVYLRLLAGYIERHPVSLDNLEEALVIEYGIEGLGYIESIDVDTDRITLVFPINGTNNRLSISPIGIPLTRMRLANPSILKMLVSDKEAQAMLKLLGRVLIKRTNIPNGQYFRLSQEEWEKLIQKITNRTSEKERLEFDKAVKFFKEKGIPEEDILHLAFLWGLKSGLSNGFIRNGNTFPVDKSIGNALSTGSIFGLSLGILAGLVTLWAFSHPIGMLAFLVGAGPHYFQALLIFMAVHEWMPNFGLIKEIESTQDLSEEPSFVNHYRIAVTLSNGAIAFHKQTMTHLPYFLQRWLLGHELTHQRLKIKSELWTSINHAYNTLRNWIARRDGSHFQQDVVGGKHLVKRILPFLPLLLFIPLIFFSKENPLALLASLPLLYFGMVGPFGGGMFEKEEKGTKEEIWRNKFIEIVRKAVELLEQLKKIGAGKEGIDEFRSQIVSAIRELTP